MWGVFVSWMNVTANQLRMSGGGATPFENTKSLLFDGTDDYIDLGGSGDALLDNFNYPSAYTGDITTSFWYKHSSSGVHNLFYIGNANYAYGQLIGFLWVANDLRISFFDNQRVTITATVDSNWHHLLTSIINNGGGSYTLKAYLDGTEVANTTLTGLPTGMNTLNRVNTMGATGNGSYDYPGNIDEFAIWNSDESANASAIYNSGTPDDLTSFSPTLWLRMGDGDTYPTITDHGSAGADGTMTNMSSGDIVNDTANNPPFNTKSISFDNVDDSLVLNHTFDATNGLTYSCWLKPSPTASILNFLSSNGATGGAKSQFNMRIVADGRWFIYFNGGPTYTNITGLTDGNWHHIAMTVNYSNGDVHFYKDGVVSSTVLTWGSTYSTAVLKCIGSANTSGVYSFGGEVDEFSIFENIENIATLYNGGVPDDLSGLSPSLWYRMGEGDTYPTITDHGSAGIDGTMTNMTSGDIVEDTP